MCPASCAAWKGSSVQLELDKQMDRCRSMVTQWGGGYFIEQNIGEDYAAIESEFLGLAPLPGSFSLQNRKNHSTTICKLHNHSLFAIEHRPNVNVLMEKI